MATYTESFDLGVDDTDLADQTLDLTWAHVTGSNEWETFQGEASPRGSTRGLVEVDRAEHDTAGSDMYAQCVVTSLSSGSQGGVAVRFASAATTCFFAEVFGNGDLFIQKYLAGTRSTIATVNGLTVTGLPKVLRLEVSGSTLTAFWDGVQALQTTDTDIASGTRGGLTGFEQSGQGLGFVVDSFEFGDLGGGAELADTITETATATDTVTATLIVHREIVETATATDQGDDYTLDVAETLIETATATDTVTAVLSGPISDTITEQATATDTTAVTLTASRDITEQATATDAVTADIVGAVLVDLHFVALTPGLAHGPALTPELVDHAALTPELVAHVALTPETVDREAGEPVLAHGDIDHQLGHGDVGNVLAHGMLPDPSL